MYNARYSPKIRDRRLQRGGEALTINKAGPTELVVCPFVLLNNDRNHCRRYIVATVKMNQLGQLDPSFVQYVDTKISAVIERYLFDDINIMPKNIRKIYILK